MFRYAEFKNFIFAFLIILSVVIIPCLFFLFIYNGKNNYIFQIYFTSISCLFFCFITRKLYNIPRVEPELSIRVEPELNNIVIINDNFVKPKLVKISNNVPEILKDKNMICVICLEYINENEDLCYINNCKKHIYHRSCGEEYSKYNYTFCPLCNR